MNKTTSTTRVVRTQTASRNRRDQEKRDLRERILKAAGEEFLEKGYDSFSLRRVAERIGYTPTTIYLHFQSKDDLLLATVQDGFEAFDKRMEYTAATYSDPLKRIEALGRAYIEFGLENPALYRLMFMQRSDFYFMPRFIEDGQSQADKAPKAKADSSNGVASKRIKTKVAAKSKVVSAKNKTAPGSGIVERPRTVAMALLVAAVEEAMKAGVLKKEEPLIAADVLWAGAHGLVSLATSPLMSPEHAHKVIDSLLATLISGARRR